MIGLKIIFTSFTGVWVSGAPHIIIPSYAFNMLPILENDLQIDIQWNYRL